MECFVKIPENFVCPITTVMMENPVVAADGFSYERSAITAWLASGRDISPTTGQILEHRVLIDNNNLKNIICDFNERMPKVQKVQKINLNLESAILLREEILQNSLKKVSVNTADAQSKQNTNKQTNLYCTYIDKIIEFDPSYKYNNLPI